MKALVTGVAGFAGGHLARHLLDRDDTVAGIRQPGVRRAGEGSLPSDVELHEADILDATSLARIVSDFKPDTIFHLAAFSNPESSWTNARRALETNIIGSHNVLQAALETGMRPRVLLVGSVQQYGLVPEGEQPIGEDRPQRPLTPYGVSKSAQEVLGLRFFLAEELPVFLVRSFNHTGPGQESFYVCSSFARQVAEIENGRREPTIRVGNLSARRDFSDVRDIVRGYREILERGKPADPYNICRGEAFSIEEILATLRDLAGAKVTVEVDAARYHAVDAPLLVGDNTKLRSEVGWKPEIGLKQTLADLLSHWRENLG
jgi:GDP-4-dehydro-6-deoxy-D-mannose reductase